MFLVQEDERHFILFVFSGHKLSSCRIVDLLKMRRAPRSISGNMVQKSRNHNPRRAGQLAPRSIKDEVRNEGMKFWQQMGNRLRDRG